MGILLFVITIKIVKSGNINVENENDNVTFVVHPSIH